MSNLELHERLTGTDLLNKLHDHLSRINSDRDGSRYVHESHLAIEAIDDYLQSPAHDGEPIYQVRNRYTPQLREDVSKEMFDLSHDIEKRIVFTAPPRVVDEVKIAEIIQNFTGCPDSDSLYAAGLIKAALEKK